MLPSPDPTTRTTLTEPAPARPPVGRRRLLALAAGAALATGGVVAATSGSAGAIVDGEDTTAGENPWQVALTADGEQFCGGSLVSDRVVLTAAHCVVGTDADDIQIRAGVSDLRTDDGQTVQVAGVVEHPSYEGGSGDIAMLVLERPVALNDRVAAIPIATAAEAGAATDARVTGWGALSEADERVPDVLQTADVPTVGDDACETALDGVDGANELCAGGTGTDSCYGDSGGPLTVLTDRGRVLAGVTSWGEECGGETPGVYAEVPAFADWINDRVADPDAPLPDRLDIDLMEDFGDELPEGVEFDEDGWIQIPDAFFDEYGDDELDRLSDDEFWNLFVEWSDRNGDPVDEPAPGPGDDQSGDDDSNDDGSTDDAPSDELEFDHDAIDQLDDDAWEAWLDDLSDDEFERYLDELDALWADVDDDWTDDEFEDMPVDDGTFEEWDTGFGDIPFDDESLDDWNAEFDEMPFDDLGSFDTNDDGIVQWNELDELVAG